MRNPKFLQALNPVQKFDATMIPLVLQASIEKKAIALLFMSQSVSAR
jgi:hypothetical protein